MEIEKGNNGIGPYIGRVWIIDEIKKGAGANKLGNMIRFESFGNDDESKVKDEEIRRKVGGPGCLTSLLRKKNNFRVDNNNGCLPSLVKWSYP